MKSRQFRVPYALVLVTVAVALAPLAAHGSAKKAFERVQEGIQHYQSGDLEAAGRAFAEADVALPEDDRVAYDRACVRAAQGDTDKAIELFQKAAMSRDASVAAGSHYNLGCVNATRAEAIFGDKPEQATPEIRQQGLPMLVAAIGHYRDCLKIDPDHSNARRNLEVLRLWIKHMQDMWAKHDREKQREEMDLLTFLQMIEARQTQLRQATRLLNAEKDSPRRRQAINETRTEQLQLAEEIEPLKQKIQQSLQPPPSAASPGQPTAPPPDADQMKQAIGALNDMGNRARAAMLKAAGGLNERDLPKTTESQTDALDALNEIYTAIAPFQNVLQKATVTEEALVGQSQQAVDRAADADSEQSPPMEYDELSRNQNRVSGWSETLPMKAEQELQQLAASGASPGSPAVVPIDPNADPQQAEEEKEALKQSLEKAIELGPKIHELCEEASKLLNEEDADAALPRQEEALKLLKEIAESLPKQQQQQQDQGQNDQQKQDQDQQQSSDNRDQQQQQPKDRSRQQAEAVLRKVREREREHRERQKQLQRLMGGGVVVDRDW